MVVIDRNVTQDEPSPIEAGGMPGREQRPGIPPASIVFKIRSTPHIVHTSHIDCTYI